MTLIEKILKLSNPEELGYAGIFGFLIQTHIVLGLLTLVTASIVLVMTKGTALHKRVGLVVVIALMANFLLGVPLGTFGRMANGLEANLLTSVGAVYVGVLAFSGFRLAQAGALARGWLDKTFWGFTNPNDRCVRVPRPTDGDGDWAPGPESGDVRKRTAHAGEQYFSGL